MRISFTGTRKGMSDHQKQQLRQWLLDHAGQVALAAHGCCVGADVEFHELVREVLGRGVFVAVFPSTAKTRAPIPADANYVASPAPPLERDKDIVDLGHDILLVAPLQLLEVTRSGTWATKRYADRRKVPSKIFWRYSDE